MKYVKYLLFMFLFIPCIVFGKMNYDDAVDDASKYASSLSDNYEFIFVSDNNLSKFISKEEFSSANSKTNSKISYLSNGGFDFWLNKVGDDGNEKFYVASYAIEERNRNSLSNVKVCEYVKNDVKVKGKGTNDDPWEFVDLIKTYTVTFNPNGGSGEPESETRDVGVNLNLSNYKPTRDGCEFLGWSVSKNGEVIYGESDTYNEGKTITLYAKWLIGATASDVDYSSIDKIKVLNIFPNNGDHLSDWLKNNTTFDVTKISLSDFNSGYSSKLIKDSTTGKWNYDIIVFGFSNCNGYCDGHGNDLTYGSSKYVETYITSGYPVIFGHDTLAYSSYFTNNYFNSLSDYLGVTKGNKNEFSNRVTNVKKNLDGILFKEPNEISSNNMFNVPETHSSYGVKINDIESNNVSKWLIFENDNSNKYLPYLLTYSKKYNDSIYINTAFINTGNAINVGDDDSNDCEGDKCWTSDEIKIIENTIYYLYARSNGIS